MSVISTNVVHARCHGQFMTMHSSRGLKSKQNFSDICILGLFVNVRAAVEVSKLHAPPSKTINSWQPTTIWPDSGLLSCHSDAFEITEMASL